MEIIVDETRRRTFQNSIKAMADFKTAFGRGLSSDFVAELYVADELSLKVVEPGRSGYDALGPNSERYQVKFRSSRTLNVDLNNFDFDFLVLVNMDENYQLTGMWRITKAQAEDIFVERVKFGRYQTTQKHVKSIGESLSTRQAAEALAASPTAPHQTPDRRWREIRGAASYPLAGEDAQDWVSHSRRQDDANSGLGR